MKTRYLLLAIFLPIACGLKSQSVQLDQFESTNGWDFIKSDGVSTAMSLDQGVEGQAIRFDYDFTKGTGYGGIQKWFAIDIPENYEFTFMLKASSPANNFEIKLIDSSGNNVWWVSNRNYTFPEEWKKIRIKRGTSVSPGDLSPTSSCGVLTGLSLQWHLMLVEREVFGLMICVLKRLILSQKHTPIPSSKQIQKRPATRFIICLTSGPKAGGNREIRVNQNC